MKITRNYISGYNILRIKNDVVPHVHDDMMTFIRGLNIGGKNVVDGGSNMGLTSLVFSDAVGEGGIVFAFEIQPILHQLTCANAVINGKKNIVAINKALSEHSGEWFGFSEIDYDVENVSSVGVKTEPKKGTKKYIDHIETIAVDDMNLEDIGLIKLDIEGYEPEALRGMKRTIAKWKPHLIIEASHNYLYEKGGVHGLENWVKEMGYEITKDNDHNLYAVPK